MSTTVRSFRPQSSLMVIYHYGREALLNRWKMLTICAFGLVFLPRFIAFFVFSKAAGAFSQAIEAGALSSGNLIDGLSELGSKTLEGPLMVTLLALMVTFIGVLAMAQLTWDYFEQTPSTIKSAVIRGAKVFLRKAVGVVVILVFILFFTSLLSILRVVALCLLVMLPIELVAGHHGGIKSVWSTLFLKYAAKTPLGRWPVFSNMMTLGGLALSLAFIGQLSLAYLGDIDVVLGVNAHRWIEPIHLVGGGTVSFAAFVQHILGLIFDSVVITLTLPFAAALRYFGQKSTFTAAV